MRLSSSRRPYGAATNSVECQEGHDSGGLEIYHKIPERPLRVLVRNDPAASKADRQRA